MCANGLTARQIAGLMGLDHALNFTSGMVTNSITSAKSREASWRSYKQNLMLQQQAQAWQERMANTAHQREVTDLKAAGLNPILSATGGSGASAGSVGASSVSPVQPNIQNPLANVEGVLSMLQSSAQIDQTKATAENLRTNSNKQSVETFHEFQKINKTLAETKELLSRSDLNEAQRKKAEGDLEMLTYLRDNMIADTKLKGAQLASVGQDVDINEPSADFARKHPVLKNIGNFIHSYTDDAAKILHGATGVYDAQTRRHSIGQDSYEEVSHYDSRGRLRSSSRRRKFH